MSFGILLGLALTSEAQYKFLLQGEESPFDSAVAIHLPKYRVESDLLKKYPQVIEGLQKENSLLEGTISKVIEKENLLVGKNQLLSEQLNTKQETIIALQNQMNLLHEELNRPPRWYQRKELWGGAGLIVGILITQR